MVAPLRRVIVKRPQQAYRNPAQVAEQWRALNYAAAPDFNRACEEHASFVRLLQESGAEVLFLPENPSVGLDSIYTHDPALVTEAGVITFRTGKELRRGEGPALAKALAQWDIPILGTVDAPGTAEGGDMIWLDRTTLIVGRGFRTNGTGMEMLRSLLAPLNVNVIAAGLPYWTGPTDCLHLMSFISLLDSNLAVVYRKMLPVSLFELLQDRGVQLIDIAEEEFATQACNVLAVAPRDVIVLKGNPVTRERLEEAGCKVREFAGDEISFKGAGGPTCLTRPLLRT